MFNKRILLILIILSTLIGQIKAQHLSLEDCRKLAIENNKTLKIAAEQERVAYYEKKEALAKYFPEIAFSGSYLRNQKNLRLLDPAAIPTEVQTPPINIPPIINHPGGPMDISPIRDKVLDATEVRVKNVWALGFHLSQPIFMGGKIVAYNDLRAYAEDLAKTMKDTKLTDVIVEVDNAYWQVVSLSNKHRLAKSYVELLNKMDSDISMMEEEGMATKADRLSVSVRLNEAEMTLTKAENGLSLSKMLLSQICGLDITDKLSVKDEFTESLTMMDNDDLVPSVEEALSNRNEIKSLTLASKIFQKKEQIARSEFIPKIALQANYEWTNPNSFHGFKTDFGGMWNIGVGVQVPLNFFTSSTKLNAAKAETRIKKLELEDAKEKIVLQVNQESYKLNEARKKLTSALKNTDKADENLRYANAGFEEGVISASDALSAHTAWLSAHAEKIDAQIDIKLCRVYLNKALGRKLQ